MMQARLMDPSHPGDRDRITEARHVVVVGGGIAGLAAATVLTERGVAVTVLEREARLGGRLGAWREVLADGSEITMERGFHAFFRQYFNLRAWLRRIDPQLTRLVPLSDYPILGADGRQASFSDLPRRTPLNLVSLVRRTPDLTLRALSRVNVRLALEMLRFDPVDTPARFDQVSAGEYLDRLNFPPDARALLFDVFAHSFFNPEATMSAGEMLMLFHFYFLGNPEGLVFDVLSQPFDRGLWDPMQRHLESRGVTFRLATPIERVMRGGERRWQVETSTGELLDADAVVLAVDVGGLRAIVQSSPTLHGDATWRAQLDSLAPTLPFVVWRLWLDRPSVAGRQPFVGTTRVGLLDNISLYHLFQDEARAWVDQHGGSVVELHAYAVPEHLDEATIRDALWRAFVDLYPEYRGATIRDQRYLAAQDCPAFEVGRHALRPGVETPFPGLTLAGDFTRLPIPSALMERAATSGMMAANATLAPWRGRPEPLWTVPTRGLLGFSAQRLLAWTHRSA